MARIDDAAMVAHDYSDPSRLATRFKPFREYHQGPSVDERVLWALEHAQHGTVLEVGAGDGTFARLVRDRLSIDEVVVDLSPSMVALARAAGIDARVADAQALPFADDSFDAVVANWMLYHLPDLDRGLGEIVRVLRPGGSLIASTMGPGMLHELWDRVPDDGSAPELTFAATNGHAVLARFFRTVERIDLRGTAVFPDHAAAVEYMLSTLTRKHLASELEVFDGPLHATTTNSVFVARDPIVISERLAS